MTQLLGLTLDELSQWAAHHGLPPYRAKQIAHFLYKEEPVDFTRATALPKALISLLQEKASANWLAPILTKTSVDGTEKHLFQYGERDFIETAFIPEDHRATLCVSSQVGCIRSCAFCETGKQKAQRNLTAFEILNQWRALPQKESVTNFVFMGMGEPLDNFETLENILTVLTAPWGYAMSPSRITVSTVGITPRAEMLLERFKVNFAYSLHFPTHELRAQYMPTEEHYPMESMIRLLRTPKARDRRKLTIEYILLDHINTEDEHAHTLSQLLRGIRGLNINLIPFNETTDRFISPSPEKAEHFKSIIEKYGIPVTIRRARGADIEAACGMLSGKRLEHAEL